MIHPADLQDLLALVSAIRAFVHSRSSYDNFTFCYGLILIFSLGLTAFIGMVGWDDWARNRVGEALDNKGQENAAASPRFGVLPPPDHFYWDFVVWDDTGNGWRRRR